MVVPALLGGGDGKEQLGLLPVGAAPIRPLPEGEGGKARAADGGGFCMGDSHPAADGRAALVLPGEEGSFVSLGVSEIAGIVLELDQLVQSGVLILCPGVEGYPLGAEQIGDPQ